VTNATPKNRRPANPASDRERLERGRNRLEELLRDPGAGIRIIPRASEATGAPPNGSQTASHTDDLALLVSLTGRPR